MAASELDVAPSDPDVADVPQREAVIKVCVTRNLQFFLDITFEGKAGKGI